MEEYHPPEKLTYNSAEEIKNNIVEYFKRATDCMAGFQLYLWYRFLEQVYVESSFKFKKDEIESLNAMWKDINPHNPKSYQRLKEYHLKLRKICYEHDFFTPPKMDAGQAVFHRR